jgi:hypothetical protein
MAQTTKTTRQNRTLTVDFQDSSTYFELISDGKAFVEFVLAFILSIGFQRILPTSALDFPLRFRYISPLIPTPDV